MSDLLEAIQTIPHFEQYLGVWAMAEKEAAALIAQIQSMDLLAHIQAEQATRRSATDGQGPIYRQTEGGVAVFDLVGMMTKYGSSLSRYPGNVRIRRGLRQALSDDDVQAILLRVESPGGSVAGVDDLARDIAAANQQKPVVAYIEDLGASAAYYVASQAGRIFANPSALIGSIGTYTVIADWSQFFAAAGVKVHVIRAGEMKGVGVLGAEVTPEQLADAQRVINEINELFVQAVARGRRKGLEDVLELADGRIHRAEYAMGLGLIDGIQTFEQTLNELESKQRRPSRGAARTKPRQVAEEEKTMTQGTEQAAETKAVEAAEPKAATLAELKAEFPDADAQFYVSCLEQGLTIVQAAKAYAAEMKAKAEAARKEAEEAKAVTKKPGVEALGGGAGSASEDAADPIERWNQAVTEKMNGGLDRAKAIRAIVREDPDLHQAYLAAVNERHRRKVG